MPIKRARIIDYKDIEKHQRIFKNKKTVLVGGCFDIFHYAHLQFLLKARKQGNFLIVALESDKFIKKYKKRRPIHSQKERAEILSYFPFVDLIINLPLMESFKKYFLLVQKIKPKIIAVTKGDPQLYNKTKQAMMIGGRVKIVIDLMKKYSSRKIISKLS